MDKELMFQVRSVLVQGTNEILDEVEKVMKVIAAAHDNVDYKKRIGRTQFNGIKEGICKAACIEELILFIKYQESKRNGWEIECADRKSTAAHLIDSLNKIVLLFYKKLEVSIKEKFNEEEIRELKLMIAEKYLGYLYWQATIEIKKK